MEDLRKLEREIEAAGIDLGGFSLEQLTKANLTLLDLTDEEQVTDDDSGIYAATQRLADYLANRPQPVTAR